MREPVFFVPETIEPLVLSETTEKLREFTRLNNILKKQQAVLIAHYYVARDIQELAEFTGGFVGDSLAMAQFACQHPAKTLLVAGVRFMGESAKILNPEKQVFMPDLAATCSLDLGCPIEQFSQFCDEHSDRIVVVYVNTSAAIKARADWTVTSANALDIVDYLDAEGHKILWAPDRYLGHYVQQQTGADMIMWSGACVVHEEFKLQGIQDLKDLYPDAAVLVHPESPMEVIKIADVVGSTARLLQASQELKNKIFIVATDKGIFYQMQKNSPHKIFLEAPTAGQGATCRSCAHCPWMAMNDLKKLELTLVNRNNEILLDPEIIAKAKIPLQRMLDFSARKY